MCIRDRVKDAARALLAEQPSPGNDTTWERLRAKFPDEDPASVEQAIQDTIAESRIEDKEGSGPRWRPEQEFDPKVLIAVIKSRSSNSGAGNDGQRFSHLKSIVNTKIGQEEFSEAMSSLWRKLVDKIRASALYDGDEYFRVELLFGSPSWTCLLYTSPSPRDATLSRMPSSA